MDRITFNLDFLAKVVIVLWILVESAALFVRKVERSHAKIVLYGLSEWRRDPGLAPDEARQASAFELLEFGNYLNSGAATTNHAYSLVLEVVPTDQISFVVLRKQFTCTDFSFHFAECMTSPWKLLKPFIEGQAM